MAIYEYRCGSCGTEFEARRPMSEASDPAPCPKCGSKAGRLPSVFASKEGYSLKVPTAPAWRGPPESKAKAKAKPKPARKPTASAPRSRAQGGAARRSRARR